VSAGGQGLRHDDGVCPLLLAGSGSLTPAGSGHVAWRGLRPRNGVETVLIAPSGEIPTVGSEYGGLTVQRAYRVDTVAHWDDGVVPAITRLAFVARLPNVTPEEFRHRYEGHALIARVQHPGICKYAQHFVLGGTEDVCSAIAELHFADELAMRDRFYRDEDSPRIVDADINDYLDRERTWSLVATPVTPA
jgi:hypothetical protein